MAAVSRGNSGMKFCQLVIILWFYCSFFIQPFHYGTHYSNAGAVLFYLMRIEPFTELFVVLQGGIASLFCTGFSLFLRYFFDLFIYSFQIGKFDIADRMFTSMADCLRNCLTSTSDVKELTPGTFIYISSLLL